MDLTCDYPAVLIRENKIDLCIPLDFCIPRLHTTSLKTLGLKLAAVFL